MDTMVEGAKGAKKKAPGKLRRGFACLSMERRKEIASKGGSSVPSEKRAFARDKMLASRSGTLGGRASGITKRKLSKKKKT